MAAIAASDQLLFPVAASAAIAAVGAARDQERIAIGPPLHSRLRDQGRKALRKSSCLLSKETPWQGQKMLSGKEPLAPLANV